MGWHLLETLLQQVGEHATLVGKLWVTATFVFRFVIVASVGDAVYSDEQSDFYCNTETPGCKNVCFNQFSPISHLRFWAAQIISVCTPSIIFIVYTTHVLMTSRNDNESRESEQGALLSEDPPPTQITMGVSRKRGKISRKSSSKSVTTQPKRRVGAIDVGKDLTMTQANEHENESEGIHETPDTENGLDQSLADIERELAALEKEDKRRSTNKRIKFAYVIALLLRTGCEAVYIWLQYDMYGFKVPEIYYCDRTPCQHVVDCFVSRPMEKTLFLWFMFAVSCLCLVLNIVEIKYLGVKKLVKILCRNTRSKSTDIIDGNVEYPSTIGSLENGETKPKNHHGVIQCEHERRPKLASDNDSIGFSEIGRPPPYPVTSYPFVHRYGIVLDARPTASAPMVAEVEKSYL